MRDDSGKWDRLPPVDAVIDAPGVVIRRVAVVRQVLISGPDVLAQVDGPMVEWPGVVEAESYALSLRRDRVLWVNGPEMAEGWDAARNWAVSDVSDGYEVIEIAGTGALALLCRGAEVSLDQPSRSVARLLFGLGAFLYRAGDVQTYRAHVGRAQAAAFWKALEARLRVSGDV